MLDLGPYKLYSGLVRCPAEVDLFEGPYPKLRGVQGMDGPIIGEGLVIQHSGDGVVPVG